MFWGGLVGVGLFGVRVVDIELGFGGGREVVGGVLVR